MSLYETKKLYPSLDPSAPQDESQKYRMVKIDEAERFLHDEVAYRDSLSKRCKQSAKAIFCSEFLTIGVTAAGAGTSAATGV